MSTNELVSEYVRSPKNIGHRPKSRRSKWIAAGVILLWLTATAVYAWIVSWVAST